MTRHPALFLTLGALLAACPAQPVEPDAASVDAGTDVGRPDATRDALACSLGCASTRERCCFDETGAEQCIDVASDVHNCGLCGFDCELMHRGDRCSVTQCACGAFEIGCTGNMDSFCCPIAPDGRAPRCANLGRDFDDCGSCGRVCDATRANRCEGGTCQCGLDGDVCAGNATDLCCVDIFEVASCVDTTRDHDHCGACNRRCGPFENCIDGECIDFTIPDGGAPLDAGVDASGSDV